MGQEQEQPEQEKAERQKQEYYRDARTTNQYDSIWQGTGKCVFCDLRDKYLLREENGIVLTISLFAYIDGHLMIIPRRHVRSARDLTPTEWDTVRKFTYIAKKMIKDTHHIKGVQYVLRDGGITAQSTVSDHLHIHCIPFDAPDLSVWNYRQLKYTPLENVRLYKRTGSVKYDQRFEEKYRRKRQLSIDCSLILINTRNEVLFHERPDWAKVGNGWITPPGGGIDNLDRTLEQELAREVYEETGLQLDPERFELVSSRIEDLERHRSVPALGTSYPFTDRFLWNIYVLKGHDPATSMRPSDDACELLWVPLSEVPTHPRISAGVKAAIARVTP